MPRKINYGVDYDDEYDDYDYDYDYDMHVNENTSEVRSAPQLKQEARRPVVWHCSICTYANEEGMIFCDICGVVRNPTAGNYKNCDNNAAYICQGPGVSKLAKSLFTSLRHSRPQKAVVYRGQTDGFGKQGKEVNECLEDGNFKGYFHEFHMAFSTCNWSQFNIAPFKFDTPSPDDLVSSGLLSSKGGSKANHLNTKSGPTEKMAAVRTPSRVPKPDLPISVNEEAADSQSALESKGKHKSKDDRSSSSLNERNVDGVSTNVDSMSLSEKSRNVNKPRRVKAQANYQPEKWMLLNGKDDNLTQLNLAIVGHVDSGKSTLSGRLLHLLGRITQKEMHKYEKEAKIQGKGSFSYAWALDESAEERERGITMTVAVAYFESKRYHVVVLDSPGHKDFVPNLISGATQADAAILVIDAITGAFEAGMDVKGQTREHAQLIRSFGVDQLIVAVNKMDTVEYSKDRFDVIRKQLGAFLRTCGFKDSSISWIPLSAMGNQNLVAAPSDNRLSSWYRGPCLLDAIDLFQPPTRDFSKPLLMPICDVVRSTSQGHVAACGKLEAGGLRSGSKVLVMPSGELGVVRSLERDSEACSVARAGDSVAVTLQGIDASNVMAGGVLCHPDFPVAVVKHIELKVLILDLTVPILTGSQLEFHVHHAKEVARVVKLVSLLDPKTGKVKKTAPRCLTSKQNAIIEVVLDEPVCVEEFSSCKALGRVFLRTLGRTVGLGIVTRIVEQE